VTAKTALMHMHRAVKTAVTSCILDPSLQALLPMTSLLSCRARELTCHYGHVTLVVFVTYFLSNL